MSDTPEHMIDIQLVGFSPGERSLLISLFKTSDLRATAYCKWRRDKKQRPDCVLLDVDEADGRMFHDLQMLRPDGLPTVTIGAAVAGKFDGVNHVPRPIRWAAVLVALDTIFSIRTAINTSADTSAPIHGAEKKVSTVENELELQQLEPWYDRSKTTLFQTAPAILVVDPDSDAVMDIAAELSGSGYRVDQAKTVAEAIQLMARERYNCVILETQLPDEDAYEVCRRLRQSRDENRDKRRTASIILTSSRSAMERVRGALAGCDAYLSKPVQTDKLIVALEKFLPDWRLME